MRKAPVAAADKPPGRLESLFQSEIKEEKTQKLDTVAFCYLTFTQQAIKPPAPEQKASCQNDGGRLRKGGQAFTVVV